MNANVWHSVHEFSLKDSDLEVGNKFSEWDRGRILYNFCVGFEVKRALDLVGRGEENKLPWLPVLPPYTNKCTSKKFGESNFLKFDRTFTKEHKYLCNQISIIEFKMNYIFII